MDKVKHVPPCCRLIRNTKINQLDPVFGVNHDILGLQIAMAIARAVWGPAFDLRSSPCGASGSLPLHHQIDAAWRALSSTFMTPARANLISLRHEQANPPGRSHRGCFFE